VASVRVGQALRGVVERRQHWRAAVEEDRGEARETAGEGVAVDRADKRESQRDAGNGATSGLRAEIRGGAQREAGECDRQERPDRPERARHREEAAVDRGTDAPAPSSSSTKRGSTKRRSTTTATPPTTANSSG